MLNAEAIEDNRYIKYSRDLFSYFVTNCRKLYGSTFTVYNVHNLLHIADDVEQFHCTLNEISAFPFENFLQALKKMVRNSRSPLIQVSNRLQESNKFFTCDKSVKKFKISNKAKDSCFGTRKMVVFVKMVKPNGDLICNTIKFKYLEDFFTRPCRSSSLDIWFIKGSAKYREKTFKRSDFITKFVCLPCNNGKVVVRMLHGII